MKYDLAIIGGGPAGLMAALRAGESGQKVILIEKNERLGLKLLMTGGGRCNITNNIPDYHKLAASFGSAGRFLLSAFSRFGVSETIDFFTSRGLKIKIEKDNQVFPQSDRAVDVLNILVDGVKRSGGLILTGDPVQKFIFAKKKITGLILSSGQKIAAVNYLLATGGLSYPATGSSGDGYQWLQEFGHTIIPLRPALGSILVKEKFVKDLEGLSLETVALRLFCRGKKIAQESGPIIFTAVGLSGPAVLNLSRYIDFNRTADWQIALDLQPQYLSDDLARRLQADLMGNNKFLKNSLEGLVPLRLAETLLNLAGFSSNKLANSLNRVERERLVGLMKKLNLTVQAIAGYERAMATGGGVDLKEVDSRTLRSKIISNLFIAGEILDLVGPTGGYNLQLAWSTGQAVGAAVGAE
ncbi:MAG: NAD(P)/FAD-dependent oxidoreductase [Patescibacteria group bacterium]